MAQFQEVFFHSVFKTTKKVSFSSENWVEWIHKTFSKIRFWYSVQKSTKKWDFFEDFQTLCGKKKCIGEWQLKNADLQVNLCFILLERKLVISLDDPSLKMDFYESLIKGSLSSLARALTAICLEIGLARTIWCFREKESWKIHDY